MILRSTVLRNRETRQIVFARQECQESEAQNSNLSIADYGHYHTQKKMVASSDRVDVVQATTTKKKTQTCLRMYILSLIKLFVLRIFSSHHSSARDHSAQQPPHTTTTHDTQRNKQQKKQQSHTPNRTSIKRALTLSLSSVYYLVRRVSLHSHKGGCSKGMPFEKIIPRI